MYKDKRFLAIIPARAGSKGIANKNIVSVCGKPLINYTIEAAQQADYLDRIVVSTDSRQIAQIAQKSGADAPFIRPDSLATDHAKTIDVVLHAIEWLHEAGDCYDYVVILQPTQPLRRAFHIDQAIGTAVDNQYHAVVSVSPVREHPLLMRTIDQRGVLQNLLSTSSTVRRQDFTLYYRVNGAIYINKIDAALNTQTSLNDNLYPYKMASEYDLDIDEPNDLAMLEIILAQMREH